METYLSEWTGSKYNPYYNKDFDSAKGGRDPTGDGEGGLVGGEFEATVTRNF